MSGNDRDHTYNINYCSIKYVIFFYQTHCPIHGRPQGWARVGARPPLPVKFFFPLYRGSFYYFFSMWGPLCYLFVSLWGAFFTKGGRAFHYFFLPVGDSFYLYGGSLLGLPSLRKFLLTSMPSFCIFIIMHYYRHMDMNIDR